MELLVSISIVAVLVVALGVGVGPTLAKFKSTKCVSNLRQIGLALQAYAAEHEQKYPPAYGDKDNTEPLTWMWQLKPYLNMSEDSMGASPAPRAAGVCVCPEFRQADTRNVSYALNNLMTRNAAGFMAERPWSYSTILIHPANTIIVAEVNASTEVYSPISGGPVAQRHPGPSANYLFADGHAENIKALIPASDSRWNANPGN